MTNKRILGLTVLVLLLALMLAACGASGDFASNEPPMPQEVMVEKVLVEEESAEGYISDATAPGVDQAQLPPERMIMRHNHPV